MPSISIATKPNYFRPINSIVTVVIVFPLSLVLRVSSDVLRFCVFLYPVLFVMPYLPREATRIAVVVRKGASLDQLTQRLLHDPGWLMRWRRQDDVIKKVTVSHPYETADAAYCRGHRPCQLRLWRIVGGKPRLWVMGNYQGYRYMTNLEIADSGWWCKQS